MATTYLAKKVKKLGIDPKVNEVIEFQLTEISSKCFKHVQPNRSKLRPLIHSILNELNADPVEEHVRKFRISNIKQQKTLLEAKLDQINKSIQQGLIEETKAQRPNLQNEKVRHEFFKEEKEKSKMVSLKVKEYYAEQLRRQEKIKKHIEKLNQDIDHEKHLKYSQQKEKHQKFEEDYNRELEIMQERARKRKKELEDAQMRKAQYAEQLKEKPLHKKIEEKYFEQVEMKELERRKEELAKKRQIFQPLNKSELIEHARKHDQILREKERNPSAPHVSESHSYHSKFLSEVMKRDSELRAEEERILREKLKRVENKKIYANCVREMYVPPVDKFKQMEIILRMEKMKNPVIKKKYNIEGSTAAQSDSELKRVVKKKKTSEEILTGKRAKSKVIDYLAEQRNKRKNFDVDEDYEDEFDVDEELEDWQKAQKFNEKAKKLEKKARKAEMVLNPTDTSLKNIDATQKVDSMIISSIRAKLNALKLT